ncbi:hypothetical protein EON65_12235 [archaeon]|nr:MAG: hypothetical protein EON65_12235 [archaeon]
MTVYKLVAAGTVDEDIFELGEKKSQLSRAVLSTNKQADETGDITLISQILSKALMKHMQGNK